MTHYTIHGKVNGQQMQTIIIADSEEEAREKLEEDHIDEWSDVEVED